MEFKAPKTNIQTRRVSEGVKFTGYLRQWSSVVVIDTVTTRQADPNAAILTLLGASADPPFTPSNLSAVSYRAAALDEEPQQLQIWPAPLALGESLPTLPLWIAADFSVPLDLDASYRATCDDLRIRQAG